jgi:hypothetical protein
MTAPLIINGFDHGTAIGYLTDPDGNIVPVRSRDPVDLIAATIRAIGTIPLPPQFGLGGQLVPILDMHGMPVSYTYDPSGDEVNKDELAAYQTRVSAWNARAAIVKEAIQTMIGKG